MLFFSLYLGGGTEPWGWGGRGESCQKEIYAHPRYCSSFHFSTPALPWQFSSPKTLLSGTREVFLLVEERQPCEAEKGQKEKKCGKYAALIVSESVCHS